MSELFVEQVEPVRDDGVHLRATRITPDFDAAEKCHGAGVVVVTGEDGLDDEVLERVVRPLAVAGYFVVALPLGALTGEPADLLEDLHAAVLSVKELARGRIGVIGLGAAAPVALAAAAVLPHLDAVVHVGGGLPGPAARLSRVRAAILVHHATLGSRLDDDALAELQRRLARAHAPLTIRRHDANDALFDGRSHEARVAWDQTRDFLALNLT